jgi:hypothetical protein
MMAPKPESNKKWYTSKTVWFNILTIGGAVAGGLGGVLPALAPILSVEHYQVLLFLVGALNVTLRAVTKGPIDWKPNGNTKST